jgi:hypothetical protein
MNEQSLRLATTIATLTFTAATMVPASAGTTVHGGVVPRPYAQQQRLPDRVSPDAKRKLLYVADNANSQISVFSIKGSQQSPKPLYTITSGLNLPQGITTDEHGNLYVANLFNNTVTIYAPGKRKPKTTLSTDLDAPTDVKVDSSGNVYVSNDPAGNIPGFIVEYPAGSSTPSAGWYAPTANEAIIGIALLNPTQPGATSIYAAAYIALPSGGYQGYVLSCYPGNAYCNTVNPIALGHPVGIAVAQSPGGQSPFDYLVADQYVPGVDVFLNGNYSSQLVTGGTPQYIALDSTRSHIFVADSANTSHVTEYTWPAGNSVNTFNLPQGTFDPFVTGVAVSPAGTYF